MSRFVLFPAGVAAGGGSPASPADAYLVTDRGPNVLMQVWIVRLAGAVR